MRHKVFASLLFIFVSCGSHFSQNKSLCHTEIQTQEVSTLMYGWDRFPLRSMGEIQTLLDDDVEAAAVDELKLDLAKHRH